MITYTNPLDATITWTSGGRGRRPNWVNELIDNGSITMVAKKKVITDESTTKPSNGMKYWKWTGPRDVDDDYGGTCINVRIYVASMSIGEAIRELNKTFRNQVSLLEFSTCWKEIEPDEFMIRPTSGVWQMLKGETGWTERKKVA